ncbi:MAG TPA: transcription antitermination factor NusB [Microbacteriaceae bacterium]|nr:transcription antitermination factor NusB [Microbacteriaceae bacterium]
MSGRRRSGHATPARRVAYDVLAAVEGSDAYANLLLPARLGRAGLTGAEAGLATELCYGTLRMQGYYDAVLAAAGGRAVDSLDAPVRCVLRLGAHQLLGMRVAGHAAVNESVSLAKEVGAAKASGLVNAVLRRVAARPAAGWRRSLLALVTGDERLALEYSHPLWIVHALREALEADGQAPGALGRLLAADNTPAEVNLAALPGVALPKTLVPDRFSPVGYRLPGGDPAPLLANGEGLLRVQDEGSQLVALTMARARPAQPSERWLDLCAGPGGKAALLAAEAAAAGAHLWANEVVPARRRLVERALAPWPDTVQVTEGDGRTLGHERPASFDRVLVDAPCTGLGALRRRPEARWRKEPSDVARLQALQRELLASALGCVRPGGIVVYATCSPHVAETRAIVDAAVGRSGVRLLAAGPILAGLVRAAAPVPADRTVAQLWPHDHGTDGMFVAVLTREGDESGAAA